MAKGIILDIELKSLLLTYLRANVTGMAGISRPGSSQILTYYTGTTPENPSGNKNVATIEYYSDSSIAYTQTFSYDIADDIIEIVTT